MQDTITTVAKDTRSSAVMQKLVGNLMNIPGLGTDCAEYLMQSGLSGSQAVQLVTMVSDLTNTKGRATKMKHWQAAVYNFYGDRLVKVHPVTFKRIVAEIDEVEQMRSMVTAAGFSLSYSEAFLLFGIGVDGDTFVDTCTMLDGSALQSKKRVLMAATAVRAGTCSSIGGWLAMNNHKGSCYE